MERVREVRDCLKSCGAERAEDLKYFDWGSLKNTNILSEMEIEKIMLFVRTCKTFFLICLNTNIEACYLLNLLFAQPY